MSGSLDPDLVFEEWRRAGESGPAEDPESLIRRHPEISDRLRERFEAVRLLDGLFADARTRGAPERVGEYRILRELGRGGMGVVYEAVQMRMERRVALKVLHPSAAPRRNDVKRFLQEARITGRLKHTNIVAVHALGEENGLWFCAMELVDGPPLSRVIEQARGSSRVGPSEPPPSGPASALTSEGSRGGARPRRVARMFAEVAEALHAAHEAGVVHRDVKPSNILLDSDGHLRLVDFGLARLASDAAHLTRTGEVVGTPLYMSPEQVRGGTVSAQSDVYSLGATLYEVLTLRAPFETRDLGRLAAEVLTKEPERVRSLAPDVERDLETIVAKALEKDASRRYASAAEFADDLRRFADGEAIRARRPSIPARFLRTVRRHPASAALVAVVLVAATAAGLLATWAQRESDGHRRAQYDAILKDAIRFGPTDPDEGPSRAKALYDAAIALQPQRPEAYEARALEGSLGLEARLADVAEASRRGLPTARADLLRAYIFLMHGRTADAEATVGATSEAARAEDPLARLVAADRAEAVGDLATAESECVRALSGFPVGSAYRQAALRALISVHQRSGQYAKALNDVKSIQAGGDDRLRWKALECVLWRRVGNEPQASARAAEVTSQALEHSDGVLVVGGTWQSERAFDWQDALTEQAVAKYPDNGDVWAIRADCLSRRFRADESLAAWERATKIGPSCGFFWARKSAVLFALGRADEALEASEKAVRLDPKDSENWAIRSGVCRATNRLEEAEQAALRAIAIRPGPGAKRALGAAFLVGGKVAEAERIANEILVGYPRDAEALNLRSGVRIAQKRWADALADLDLALETASPDADLHALRGEALKGLGRLADAEAAWRLSLKLRPKHGRTMYVLALLLLNRLNRPTDAEAVLRELVEVKPKFDHAWNELGNARKRLRDLDGALVAYRKARELQPKDSMYAGNEGALLIDMNRPQAAHDILAEVVRENPDSMIDRFNLAVALSDLGRKDDAIAQYAEVARRNPEDGEAWTKAAALQAETDRLDDAIASVRRAIEADPEAGAYRHDLAVYLLRAKRPEEAEAAARKAIELSPADHHSQYLIGKILSDREEWEASLPYLRKAMALAPNESDYCGRATWICVLLDRHTDALDLLSGAEKRFPDKWWVHAQMGWALSDAPDVAVRDAGLAILHARKATEIGPKVAWTWLALGAALYRADRHAEAVDRIRTSLSLDSEGLQPQASYYLCMALHRLGKTEEARAEFDRGEAARKKANPEGRPEKGRPDRRLAAEAASTLGLPPPR